MLLWSLQVSLASRPPCACAAGILGLLEHPHAPSGQGMESWTQYPASGTQQPCALERPEWLTTISPPKQGWLRKQILPCGGHVLEAQPCCHPAQAVSLSACRGLVSHPGPMSMEWLLGWTLVSRESTFCTSSPPCSWVVRFIGAAGAIDSDWGKAGNVALCAAHWVTETH